MSITNASFAFLNDALRRDRAGVDGCLELNDTPDNRELLDAAVGREHYEPFTPMVTKCYPAPGEDNTPRPGNPVLVVFYGHTDQFYAYMARFLDERFY